MYLVFCISFQILMISGGKKTVFLIIKKKSFFFFFWAPHRSKVGITVRKLSSMVNTMVEASQLRLKLGDQCLIQIHNIFKYDQISTI